MPAKAARWTVGLAMAAAFALVGCGSSSSSHTTTNAAKPTPTSASSVPVSSTSGPALTRAQYVSHANSLCRRGQSETPPFPGKKSGNGLVTDRSLVLPYLNKIQSLTSSTVDGLKALHPPASLESRANAMLSAEQARLHDLGMALNAAQVNDGNGFTAAFQQDQRRDGPRYVNAALAVGAKVCASGV